MFVHYQAVGKPREVEILLVSGAVNLKKRQRAPGKIIEIDEKREFFYEKDHINELKLIVVNRHPTIMGLVIFLM